MAKISNKNYEELMRKSIKYDLLTNAIEQNVYVSEYGFEGRIGSSEEIIDLIAMFEPHFADVLDYMIEQKKEVVRNKKAEGEE